jgi:predicted aldo/keto reductase-like oxidoreductase
MVSGSAPAEQTRIDTFYAKPDLVLISPKDIGIARIVKMLNERKAVVNNGKIINTPIYYDIYLDGFGKAAGCDHCGMCAGKVKGVDVPALLDEADTRLRNW